MNPHESFADIVRSDRYWEVIRHLGSEEFNAQKSCDSLCLQNYVNTALDAHINKGVPIQFKTGNIAHRNFI